MKVAMVETGFNMVTHSQLKCIVALNACSDEFMLKELLQDYSDVWTIDTLIEKARNLEKHSTKMLNFRKVLDKKKTNTPLDNQSDLEFELRK